MKESPIFVKSFETIRWILDHTKKFPKHQRFVMAKRVEDAALSFHDCLIGAVKPPEGRKLLKEADFHLERLKTYNRLPHDPRTGGRHLREATPLHPAPGSPPWAGEGPKITRRPGLW